MCQVMTVCPPILAAVVAANALLLADLMRASLRNCSYREVGHHFEVASGGTRLRGSGSSIAMSLENSEYNN